MLYRINKIKLYIIVFVLWLVPSIANAVSQTLTTTTRDGETVTTEENIVSLSVIMFENLIILIAVIFGGIIAFQGIRIIIRALDLGHTSGTAEIAVDLKNHKINIKKITQGAVIVLVGGAIMLGAIYIMVVN